VGLCGWIYAFRVFHLTLYIMILELYHELNGQINVSIYLHYKVGSTTIDLAPSMQI